MSLLNQWIRIFYKDNTSIFDLSMLAQNDTAIPFEFVTAEDKLYIAQDLPFNNFFVEIGTANTNNANIVIEAWDGNSWEAMSNIMDGTAGNTLTATPTGLAQDGVIQFIPKRDEDWQLITDTSEETGFDLINDLEIYEKRWLRVSWDADLSVGTTIQKIGYAFCEDRQLMAIDPEIDNYLTSWAAGKTDWVEQILLASEHVVADLKTRDLIMHPGQILRLEDVSLATAYKTLSIIYNKLGPGFEFQKENADAQYEKLSGIQRLTIDKSLDGIAEGGEKYGTIGALER